MNKLLTVPLLTILLALTALAQSRVTTNTTLTQSGQVVNVLNPVQGASSLAVAYQVSGAPSALTVALYGVDQFGGVALLDTYVGTNSTTRNVSVSANYTTFQYLPTWTGGGTSIVATLTISGTSPPYVGSALPNGTTATTQAVGDSTTKVATDAFVLANAGAGGTPGGLNGQVQVNTSGAFGGATNLTYDSTSGATTIISRDKGGQVFNVKAYGAKGDGKNYFDGVTSSGGASGNATNSGNSTTPSVAAVTTTVANAIAIGVFQAASDWSVAPSSGTNRVLLPANNSYALTVQDQIKATAGTVASYGGTLASSAKWNAGHFWLSPAAGQTITFVSQSTAQAMPAPVSNITVTAPAGITSGDTMIGCIAYFNNPQTITWPATLTSVRFAIAQSAGPGLECRSATASASPPASFTWSQSNTAGTLSAVVLDYRNISTSSNLFLSSATANFTVAAVGDPICVAGIGASSGQICGTIANFISSTQIGLDASFDAGASASSLWFNFGTNDDTAFASALTAAQATPGGIVYAPCGDYVLTAALSIAPNKPVRIRGCTPGAANTESNYLNSYSPYNLNVGTVLQFDTTSLSTGAVSFKAGSFTTNFASGYALENLTVYGGAGKARDGGGNDGVDIIAFPWVDLDNVWVANFSGQGVYIDYLGNAAGQGWITNVSLDRVFPFWNGGYGVKIGSTFTAHRLENISINEAEIENNGGPGVGLVGANIQGFSLTNSIVQWNNVAAANPEIQVTSSSISGCRIQSNYVETVAATGSQSNNWITPNVTSCDTNPNYVNGFGTTANAGLASSWLTRSTPGTFASLPACSATFEGTTAAVTDSTTNTFGSTITGGGTNHVLGYCDGTAWKVMGQ